MSIDPALLPPGIEVSTSGDTPKIAEHLRSAFDDGVLENFDLLLLAREVDELKSGNLFAVAWWAERLDRLVVVTPKLAPLRSDLFQFLLARHRIAIDKAEAAK